ncbi:prokaryotic E2 ligase family D protein [Terribacillus sp. DMT04]|uniref:prokaryotic E2 ligase family D protein n=1 Tax=Terribacillus sp. DMT04 TaxID=2850441 RepID=UPI001C2BA9BC|nr:prokaryotic E2 ligase family D protein [Terribacillus sp. DMT04]QXE03519.1 prokaryotic E2 ligase family D protein [Terribacillus sp. DMT04]
MKFTIVIDDDISNFDDHVLITQEEENVTVAQYTMSLSDVSAALNNSRESYTYIETPLLPSNCLKYEKVDGSRVNGGFVENVFVEIPKGNFNITFEDKVYKIGVPRLIIKYSVASSRVFEIAIFALKQGQRIEEDGELFYFPFPNVAHESGVACFGANTLPKVEKIRHLETYHYLFFAAPFGADYGTRVLTNKTILQLFESLDNEEFNDDWLMPATTKKIGDFMKINDEENLQND